MPIERRVQGRNYTSLTNVQWHPYRNNSGEDIPPHAVLRIEDTEVFGDKIRFVVNKPNSGSLEGLAFNCHIKSPADGTGGLTFDMPAVVAFDDTSGTPASGDYWAPSDGSWLLTKHAYGFRVLGRLNPNQSKMWVRGKSDFPIRGVLANAYDPNSGLVDVTLSSVSSAGAFTDSVYTLSDVLPGLPMPDAVTSGTGVWVTEKNGFWYIMVLACNE